MENEGMRRLGEMELRIGRMEVEMGTVTAGLQRLNEDMYNHGRDGVKSTLDKFIAESRATQAERDRNDRTWRWFVGIMITILAAVASIWVALDANRQLKSGMLGVTPQVTANISADWRH